MKSVKIFFLFACLAVAGIASAQSKTETIAVAGNCGMCKKTIEKSAKAGGATSADWNEEKKVLTVKYNSKTTDLAKIQQQVAAAGYDTRDVKASDAAYDKLHGCCKYDRGSLPQSVSAADKKTEAACCSKGEKTAKGDKGEKGSCCSEGEGH
ncbi:heavy-metal-associated domain-containing protein [Terrimonas ferruginea]|uniref:heavy-metal-associated domain-containing protein n=1 Tax=Terrimonas ferruginea TaxID=249 RepID=UPI0003FE3763|nr:cation transporter [Terrimonas ferruginea]